MKILYDARLGEGRRTPFFDCHALSRLNSLVLFASSVDILYKCGEAGGVLITDVWRKVNGAEFDDSMLMVLGVSSEVNFV